MRAEFAHSLYSKIGINSFLSMSYGHILPRSWRDGGNLKMRWNVWRTSRASCKYIYHIYC